MLCPILVVALLLAGAASAPLIILTSLIVGITDALSMPSFSSIVPFIVKRKDIPAGLALNSAQFNVSRILGPALAGVLMASVGPVGCFVVSAVSYVPFIGIALLILPRRTGAVRDAESPPCHVPLGIFSIVRDVGLRGPLLTALVSAFFCGPLITFCPVLVMNSFHGDAMQFSLTIGSFGVGGLLGGIGLLGVSATTDRRWLCSLFAGIYGLVVVLVGLNRWIVLLPGLIVAGGIAMSVTNTCANTLIQTSASPAFRGRVVSLFMLASRGGMALGSLVTGLCISAWGIRATLVANGIFAVALQVPITRAWLVRRSEDRGPES